MNHCRLRIEHAFIHVYIDNLGPVINLLFRNIECFFVVFLSYQTFEFGRPGNICSLTNINKQRILGDRKRLKTA